MRKLYDPSLCFWENGKKLTILTLAVPNLFQQIFSYLISTINVAMLSGTSGEAVAAVSIANQIIMVINTVIGVFAFGAVIVMSLQLGRGDADSAGRVAGTMVVAATVFSIVMGLALVLSTDLIMDWMDVGADVRPYATEFFRIKNALLPISALSTCFSSILVCCGLAMQSFLIGVVRSLLNVGLTYTVLHTALPFSDVAGIAYAEKLALLVGIVAEVVVYLHKKCPIRLCMEWGHLKQICRFGIPGKMGNFSYTFAQVVTTSFVVSMGTLTVDAKAYIANIVAYAPLICYAIANGGRVLIGRFRGAGNTEAINRLYWQNILHSCFANLVCALVIFAFHRPLIGIFTDDPEILSLARDVMIVDIFVQVFRAVNSVTEQSLNACGNVRVTFVVSAVFCWLCSALLSYVLGILLGWGLVGIWLAFMIDELARAVFYLFYWRCFVRRIEQKKAGQAV